MSLHTVSLLVGVQVPEPVPQEVFDALERVDIESALGERGTFRLTFRLRPGLPERFLLDSGDLLRTVVILNEGHGAWVVMDGVAVVHTLATGVDDKPTFAVNGEDLTLLMDLVEVERSFPAIPIEARVQILLARYALFGVVPIVVPPLLSTTPVPAERVPHQGQTDYAYIRSLADAVGFRFTLEPGPTAGASVAYWGPEPRADRSRPALTIDIGRSHDIETLQLGFDASARILPDALVLDPVTKAAIPVPVPDISTIVAPLGAVVPPPHRRQRLRDAANLTVGEAASALLAKAARSAEAMTGRGTIDVAASRVRLRAGAIVDVRGAAKPFDGLFAVSRVRDTVTKHHHHQAFELVRAGLGAVAPGEPR